MTGSLTATHVLVLVRRLAFWKHFLLGSAVTPVLTLAFPQKKQNSQVVINNPVAPEYKVSHKPQNRPELYYMLICSLSYEDVEGKVVRSLTSRSPNGTEVKVCWDIFYLFVP